MFCFRCGNEVDDTTAFCPKCGAKIITEDNSEQVAAPESPKSIQPKTPYIPSGTPKKRNTKNLPLIIGAAALAIVTIIVIATNSGLMDDFIENQGNVTLTTSSGSSEDVGLSEIYTNDAVGISFNYPSGWVVLDSDNESEVVEMIDSQNNADSIAGFKVFNILDQDPLGVFTKDEASIREAVNEFGTFIKLENTLIGDVPTKGLMYQQAGLKGDDIVTNFWYFIGNELHQITCSYSASKADIYEPIFNAIMDSYKITTANTSGESGTSTATYLVDQSSETYQPTLILYPDGKFTLLANLYTGVGIIHGTYNQDDTGHTFNIETRSFSGAIRDDVNNFYMEADGDSLIYASTQQIGMTAEGSRFSMSNDIPESMKEFANSSGDENYNNTSATTTAADFVGTYSYDASFEDPTGKWNNFYYLLEIGLDGSALVVTQTWRGNYLFDHARVSPSDITGNTLVFDASVVGSTEPEIHSLTYLPAKDSPLGRDTIYIDDDETMPFVRE